MSRSRPKHKYTDAQQSKTNEHGKIQFAICGEEHVLNHVCILPVAHPLNEKLCRGSWIDIHHWVHPQCSVVGLPHASHLIEE